MYEPWNIALETVLRSTVIQIFAILYFSVVFWGIRIEARALRLIACTAALSALSGLNMLLAPIQFRVLFFLVAMLVVVFAAFRAIPVRERVQLWATSVVVSVLPESCLGYVAITLGWIEAGTLLADPRSVLPYLAAFNVGLALTAFVLDRLQLAPGRRVASVLMIRHNRPLTWLLLLFAANLVVSSALYFFVAAGHPAAAAVTVLLTSAVSLLILFFTIRSVSDLKNRAVQTTQETYIEQIDNLFTTIRGQRHDFLNHVQVIQSFVRRGKTAELERYVNELVGEIVEINDLIQIGNPALAALIKTKTVCALDRKIELRYAFDGMSQIPSGIASVDYVKIAGNLIDNAIDEAMQQEEANRWIEVRGWTDDDYLHLSVSNPSRPLSPEQKTKLFQPGFTTKGPEAHTGLGLSIVKERVSFYRGDLRVDDGRGDVLSFEVKLPLHWAALTR